MSLTATDAWKALATAANGIANQPLKALLADEARAAQLTHNVGGCHFDFAKQWVDASTLECLHNLAAAAEVPASAAAMLRGDPINRSEGRAVLHSALRGGAAAASVDAEVSAAQQKMTDLANAIRSGTWRGYTGKPITDIVHIGIGGSHLGPELVVEALADYADPHLTIHFAANIDANDLRGALKNLNPATTLFIVVSKSFTTLETQVNATSARSWFVERTGNVDAIAQHFIGVTTNEEAAGAFGLDVDNLLPMWDWVGGRFSLWSAVGLPILCAVGPEHHRAFLDGARIMDEHFARTPVEGNVPMLSALFATWNYNFLGAGSLAVLPYDERLALLPDYLQQLEMESNGKSVSVEGQSVDYHTMPILWGGTGTKGQHAYHQLLHQGTRAYAADFIVIARDEAGLQEHHTWLVANALAQSQAMAIGYQAPADEQYRNVPGNHPSTTIVLDELSPANLGTLLAAYEHKVFCQGAIWGINSFDQWGVELGKQLAKPIFAELTGQTGGEAQDAATARLIKQLKT